MELEEVRRHARARLDRGGDAEALAILESSADRAAEAEPAKASRLLVDAVELALLVSGPERALAVARRATDLGVLAGGPDRLRSLIRLGDALSWAGRYDAACEAWTGATLTPDERDPEILAERANAMLRLGDPAAHDAAFRALVAARETRDPIRILDAITLVTVAEVRSGRLREALGTAEDGLAAATAGSMGEVDALALVAWVAALVGDEARLREVEPRASRGLRERHITSPGSLALGMLALSRGAAGQAVVALEGKLAGLRFGPVAALTSLRPFAAELVEAYARAGSLDRGARVLAATLPVALGTGQPRLIAPMRRAQGTLEDDEDAFHHALDAHAGWENVFELARTRLALGEHLRRQRRRAEARESLAAAAAGFDHVGSELWHRRALAELRLAGERLPAPQPRSLEGSEPLTRQEAEILELVQSGLSNRDIAERLVLSVKTVEGHLTSIYGKLGVASRAQAVARLASSDRGR